MGKIALDTMQANERALRASYRRSHENRLFELCSEHYSLLA